jgi:hypothetical protein
VARNFSEKKRGGSKRKQKAVYLIISEGMNKTETLYLSNFQDQERDFYIRFVKAGSNTDAESLYKTLKSKWKELGLSEEDGDKGFVVLDIDNDEKKAQKVSQLIGDNPIPAIRFIISNPTFEVWFLLHFKYTTKFYQDGDMVIGDLRKYISNYSKNVDFYQILEQKTGEAVKNAAKLAEHFAEEKWPSANCNPRTDVGELVEIIRG